MGSANVLSLQAIGDQRAAWPCALLDQTSVQADEDILVGRHQQRLPMWSLANKFMYL